MNWKVRIRNPFFWFGLLGVICSAMGVNPETLTSWEILRQQLKALLDNPYMIVSVVMAITGVFVDTSTKGFYDEVKEVDMKLKGGNYIK